MTRPEFAESMGFLESLIGRSIEPNTAAAWFLMLGHLSAEQLQRAIVAVMRQHRFGGLPPIGQIVEAAEGPQQSAALPNDQRAVLAWDRVLDAISRVGGYASARFDDPLINASIRSLGGWVALCDTPSEELRTWKRKEFLESYKAHTALGVSAEQAAPLLGMVAIENTRTGFNAPAPVEITTSLPVHPKAVHLAPSSPPAIAHERRLHQANATDEPLALGNVLSIMPGTGSPSSLATHANGSRPTSNQHRTARQT